MRRLGRGRFRLFRGQNGFSLIEVMVAVAIISAIGVVFMAAMTTSFRSAGIQDEQLTAESLARTQLEIIKAASYNVTYPVTVTVPFQYSINITSPYVSWNATANGWTEYETNNGLQKITVRVSREGGKSVVTVEALKKQ